MMHCIGRRASKISKFFFDNHAPCKLCNDVTAGMSSAARPPAHCRRCAIRFPRQGRFTFALGGSRRYAAGPLKLNYAPRLTVGSLDKSAKQPLPEGPKDPKQWVSSGVPKYKVMQSYRKSSALSF